MPGDIAMEQFATNRRPATEATNAIAVIGMAGRFPGARNLDEFRRNLEAGVESITVLSDRELLEAGVDPKLLANPNFVKAVPLLEDADLFDAAFFGYSPREAAIMDPQQRLFLECAWEALEDAGRAGNVAGSATGVFSGAGGIMSSYLLSDTHFTPQLTGTTASLQHVGNDKDYLSTRVSYKFDLRGPSLTVQSACSTSLVAVHVACQSLLTGECDMALAGGTTVRVPQRTGYLYKEGNVFSRDGHCRAFDADADGTVFGSGIGVVVLKRLKDALRDGDPIRAVVRATAISNDGGTKTSYWAPHSEGQAEAMRRAVAAAQIDASTIGYVEGHGTATKVGDPTEIRALNDAFGSASGGRCAIGSVKSNIGHPESAAGVAGLIKAILSVEHDVLFPSLHYSRPNPLAEFGERFYVNTVLQPWPRAAHPRRAGVNSLGIGGTNAFAIVEQAPPTAELTTGQPRRPSELLLLSAKSPEALDALTSRLSRYLAEPSSNASLADVCYTTHVGRAHFPYRRAIVASSRDEAVRVLSQPDGSVSGHADLRRALRVAFLFSGQGSQYVQMARELYETDRTFREAFDGCAAKASPLLPRPLAEVVYPPAAPDAVASPSDPIHETVFTQVALFAVEYALATLWRSWGVEPAVLVGHSVGEIVAACVAGVLGLDDALRLVAARGRLMQALPKGGGMAAVKCDPAMAAAHIASFRRTLSIAAVNGPADVVLSGALADLETVTERLAAEGVTVVRLRVSHAFHSPLIEPMLAEFEQVARSMTLRPPTLPLVSNVTGRLAGADVTTPEYWVRHVREAVRFADGIVTAAAQDVDVFLEIGPAPVLIGLGRQSVPVGRHAWLPSLRAGRSDWRQMSDSLAALYARGADIDWQAFHRHDTQRRVHLPTYPFQRQRYWIDPPAATASAAASGAPMSLLGHRLRLPGSSEVRFEARWSPSGPAYFGDHRLFERVVVPGASHMAMVLSALRAVGRDGPAVIEDVVFPQALTLDDDERCTAQLVLASDAERHESFSVMSLADGDDENDVHAWRVHATGRIGHPTEPSNEAGGSAPLAAWQARCHAHQSGEQFYDRFWSAGYHLRGSFRWVAKTWTGAGEVLSEFRWPELPDDAADYALYPSLIDACFQSVFSDRAAHRLREGAVFVPFSIGRLTCYGAPDPGARLWCHATVTDPDDAQMSGVDANITVCDDAGRLVARIERCQLREVSRDALLRERGTELRDALYEVEWLPEPRAGRPRPDAATPGVWIVFADGTSTADALIQHLREQGQQCVRVDAGATFASVAVDHYAIDPASPADMQRVVGDVARQTGGRCRGVVHLWSLDTTPMHHESSPQSRQRSVASAVHLVQALSGVEWATRPRLWLITRGAQPVDAVPLQMAIEQSPIWGLGRVMALEHPELACVRIDLDPAAHDASTLLDDLLSPDDEDQIAYRRGARYVARLKRSPLPRETARHTTSPARPVQVRLTGYGQFEHLTLKPLTRRPPHAGEVEVEVRAAGLNFRDVLNALGLLQEHYATHLGVRSAEAMTFGFESAGTVVAIGDGVTDLAVGDDVLTMGTHDALGSFVTLPRAFVTPKPASLTFEEAATLPLAFLTAYYGLHRLAGLKPGERVLIHAAAGGVGQACVQWARHIGAEIFATASPAKWDVLRTAGVQHVMSSRTLDFAPAIAALTSGEGVDVVINALSAEFVDASFAALKHGGRFIELGKRGVWSTDEARTRRPDATYHPFDLMEIAQRDPGAIASLLHDMSELLREGALKPLPHRVFPVEAVTEAFRFMAEARHVGKIVVAMPARSTRHAAGTSARADASYLITGGLGALGLEIARRLAEDGARHLALTGRRAAPAAAQAAVTALRDAGVEVVTLEADVASPADVARMLDTIGRTMPPLRGVVHAAGVLDDGVLLQQTWERFERVLAPKVSGAWNLHLQTRDRPLDFFVCFSSIASLVGNPGQSNYAAANAFMDALAHQRRAHGLVGLSVNWGPWDEIGMAAAPSGQRQRRLGEQGFRPIAPRAGTELFSRLLGVRRAQVGVMPINWTEYLRREAPGAAFFRNVSTPAAKAPADTVDFRRQLEAATDPRALLAAHVRTVVGKVLGKQDVADMDERSRLFDLGLESLMAVELRGRFEQSIGCALRPTLLFDYPTIEALVEHLAGKFEEQRARPAAAAAAAAPVAAPGADDAGAGLAELDENEIADRLAQELLASSKAQEP
jgi:myxalamid-type polyketide synthase MxaB